MALKDNEGKKYTNEHPKFSIETNSPSWAFNCITKTIANKYFIL